MPEESRLWKGLGEDISYLILSANWMDSDVFTNVGSEEVISLVDVFCSGSVFGIVCNLYSTTIVLEDSA